MPRQNGVAGRLEILGVHSGVAKSELREGAHSTIRILRGGTDEKIEIRRVP